MTSYIWEIARGFLLLMTWYIKEVRRGLLVLMTSYRREVRRGLLLHLTSSSYVVRGPGLLVLMAWYGRAIHFESGLFSGSCTSVGLSSYLSYLSHECF